MAWLLGGMVIGLGLGYFVGYKRSEAEQAWQTNKAAAERGELFQQFGLQVIKGDKRN